MKKMKLMIMLSMALSVSCLYAQEVTNTGAGNLKLGMTMKQFKTAYPTAKIKKAEGEEGAVMITGVITDVKGSRSAEVSFDGDKAYAINLYSNTFKVNGVPIGSTYKEVSGKAPVSSVRYTPDGDEAGLIVSIKGLTNVQVFLNETPAIKLKLKKYEYADVPLSAVPPIATIKMVYITKMRGGGGGD
jgi:hypothetical protein